MYEGARWDWIAIQDWERDPDGNIVHGSNGLPVLSQYKNPSAVSIPPRLDMGLDQHRQVEELYAFILVRRPCRRHRFLDD